MKDDTMERLARYERTNRRLSRMLALHSIVLCVLCAGLIVSCASIRAATVQDELRVRTLVVVDPAGVERVRIGGDLPDAVIKGKVTPRGAKAAGVLVYDDSGQERGGYVTWDDGNVGLTLDSREGQTALFVAGPEPATALQIWHGKDLLELRSDDEGTRMTTVKDGKVVAQAPEITVLESARCDEWRSHLANSSAESVMQSCTRRYKDAVCMRCLDGRGTQ